MPSPAVAAADENVVVVAVKAERVISSAAIAWAFENVARPGDLVTLLAVLTDDDDDRRKGWLRWLPKFGGSRGKDAARNRVRARRCEASASCSAAALQMQIGAPTEVSVALKVVDTAAEGRAAAGGAVAAESKRLGARWVVLDSLFFLPSAMARRIHHDENADSYSTTIPPEPTGDRWRRIIIASIALAVLADVLVVTFILYVDLCRTDPIYLVRSLSISGLEHETPLNRSSTVSPEFALTVVGKNPSLMSMYVVEGGFAEVSYRGVTLGTGGFPAFKMTPFEEMVVERTMVLQGGKRLGLLDGVGRRLVKEVIDGRVVALEIVMEVISTRRTLGLVWRLAPARVWCGVEVGSGGRIVSLRYKKFKMHHG